MQSIRLLYVEDNPQDADQTRQYFARHAADFELEIVDSGERFLARLKQQTFDVLLIDNRLPDIEGVELLNTLEHGGAHPPVVMLSGARDAKVVVQALSLGAADYVPKRLNYLVALPELLRTAVYTSRTRALRICARALPASHILYIEHDPADVARTQTHLDNAFIIEVVDTAKRACELLIKPHSYDLILCGENLEGLSALDLLYELKQAQPLPPFIVLTRAGHEYEAIAALKLGAHDYLVEREGYLNQLPIAIKNAIAQERLRKEHARMASELAESTLLESDTRWQFAVEGAGDGLWDWDVAAKSIYYSRQLREILGFGANEQASGLDEWSSRIHPDDRAQVMSDLESQLNGQSTVNAREYRVQRKDGSYIWILGRMRVMRRDAIGNPLRVVGTQSDITERKRVERKIEMAASVFTHAHEGIIMTDAAGIILEVNETFSRLCGYSRAETVGRNLSMFKSNRQSAKFYALMWLTLTEKGYWYGELWNRRKNGEEYAVMLTISAVRDPGGTTQNYVALFTDITVMKEHEQQLERIAQYDALTRLPNRLLLAERLHHALLQCQGSGRSLAVVYLDLDDFKKVNDEHGHQVGDELLVTLAQAMKAVLRDGDTLARIGGDEFVAVLVDLNHSQDCHPLLERLLQVASDPVVIGELVLHVSVSIGVTIYPQDASDTDLLVRHADQAMYKAKQAGRNRYLLFDVAQDAETQTQHESVKDIERALASGEFVLFYQPKVNILTRTVVGTEALIRWQHPQRGLLLPGEFLPAIENHALSVVLGEWVLATALAQVSEWRSLGLELPVSVNVGAHQLQQNDFALRLAKELANHPDVQPAWLELEVLETTALQDMSRVSGVMRASCELGVRFALDDFGTGYSSLTYLKLLPAAVIKIDQSFVNGMLHDPHDLAIVKGVIGLAAAFHREVIAEGVETTAHADMLLSLGCELVQGYGIARPMPAREFVPWFARWKLNSGTLNVG